MKTLLSLGHGYCARALARHLSDKGWAVIGTTRDPAKAEALAAEGVEPLLWHPEHGADLAPALARATHILHSASPTEGRDPFLTLCPGILKARPEWMGYLSTTGVYGDTRGDWVDESTPPVPARARSGDRVMAERAWLDSGLPVHVFRLAGIYGPGRGPFEKIRNGSARRILKEGQVFSRIHVEDIVQVLLASMAKPRPGAVYNLCDDLPSPAAEVLSHAAARLGLPEPPAIPFEEAKLPPLARSFYEECRRVRNDLIKTELGIELRYPDYRAGLAGILAAESN
ncbi:SDR family oxidoreductase [Pseudogemmobacter humi]|uniref:NAD dependent epimerase/dehydratase family protein n=1 Tax=Pseudogemmobacter humi TaxID=2483812 RepID=A0A3P5WY23_9RHOB|nr:SDR family oxidoreductase [Pseudogemmobacter humi]VDC20409.1 NAD dependent epimerase/dehydratase family protein [Pseudogemmobacter humi]